MRTTCRELEEREEGMHGGGYTNTAMVISYVCVCVYAWR